MNFCRKDCGMLVKICGLTNPNDVNLALGFGADLLGFVNAEDSPRYLSSDEIARIIAETEPTVPTVLVTHSRDIGQIINEFEASTADVLQVHVGLPLPDYLELKSRVPAVIANISIDSDADETDAWLERRVTEVSEIVDYILFDTRVGREIGGTGRNYDWDLARQLARKSYKPVIIAGGLNPLNVGIAIRKAGPFGVDVSSGVESSPGIKDSDKLRAFILAAKSP